jgi:hypothetical protein
LALGNGDYRWKGGQRDEIFEVLEIGGFLVKLLRFPKLLSIVDENGCHYCLPEDVVEALSVSNQRVRGKRGVELEQRFHREVIEFACVQYHENQGCQKALTLWHERAPSQGIHYIGYWRGKSIG